MPMWIGGAAVMGRSDGGGDGWAAAMSIVKGVEDSLGQVIHLFEVLGSPPGARARFESLNIRNSSSPTQSINWWRVAAGGGRRRQVVAGGGGGMERTTTDFVI